MDKEIVAQWRDKEIGRFFFVAAGGYADFLDLFRRNRAICTVFIYLRIALAKYAGSSFR